MQDLTFGEQVKIILSRKDMTIKELARKVEARTGKKMSRQNLTQRLGRDNFQERDMRMIAEILGCPFHLNILEDGIREEAGAADQTPEETAEGSRIADAAPEKSKKAKPASADAEERAENVKDSDTAVHERDITIGELVDIHEELDALMERATGNLPTAEELRAEQREGREDHEDPQSEEVRQGQPKEQYQRVQDEAADVDMKDYEAYREAGRPDALSEYIEENPEGYSEVYPESAENEPVEKLLEEIESMERTEQKEEKKEEAQEEKTHGWRAYLMQRFKKRSKDQGQTERGAADTEHHRSEGSDAGMYMEGEPEDMYDAGIYGEEYEEAYASGTYEDSYPDQEAVEMYENSYLPGGYDEGNYQEELPTEEDEDRGEINPYTGKEYESNSVRMHPSRIGYVQVYDRANHEWTDMTEWAFLGYQERKKQLLGKDYDPPIYLD